MQTGKKKKSRKWLVLYICLAVLLLIAAPACAEKFSMKATMTFDSAEITVNSRYVNDKYILYIPGNWDLSKVYIEMTGQNRIRVGETEIVSGQVNDLTLCLGMKQRFFNAKGGRMGGTLSILHGSAIPSLYVDIRPRELKKVNADKNYVVSEGKATYIEADGHISYDGNLMSFKGRGNSTYAYSKKPYQFKLEKKADLSGMGKDKTWILLANWLDLSLLRNEVVLNLARQVGMPSAVGCQMVDVYLNGDYNGLYLMTEKIQVGKSRVQITDLEEETEAANAQAVTTAKKFKETNTADLLMLRGYEIPNDPEDITGGYILEIEKSYRFRNKITNGFMTADGLAVTIKEPTYASRAQATYIGQLVSDFHKAVLAENGISPATGKYYADYIDMESWALKWWMEEISKNYDFMASSQFMFKDSERKDGLLYAGPCWDYDLSMGNMHAPNFLFGAVPSRDFVAVYSSKKTNLYRALYMHDDFRQLLTEIYRTRVRPALGILLGEKETEEGDTLCSFDHYLQLISGSAAMNFSRWPESLVSGYYKKSGTTHEASGAFLKTFLEKRTEYLDSVWLQ